MSSSPTHRPLVELTLARLREFIREPEALFWTFLFPIVMSVAMAIAFPASSGQTAQSRPVAVRRSRDCGGNLMAGE